MDSYDEKEDFPTADHYDPVRSGGPVPNRQQQHLSIYQMLCHTPRQESPLQQPIQEEVDPAMTLQFLYVCINNALCFFVYVSHLSSH